MDSALHLAEEVVHLADEAEAFTVCGQSLREAYVGLKRMRHDEQRNAFTCSASTSTCDSQVPARESEEEIDAVERKLGSHMLTQLESSIAQDGFAEQMRKAQVCPHNDTGADELDAVMGGYVIVTKEDAVEAMASYLAAWLSSLPEAKNMNPKELQQALLTSVKELRKSRFRQILEWGRYAYRGATLAYSAFMVYENPWLVRAVATALWSAGSVISQML